MQAGLESGQRFNPLITMFFYTVPQNHCVIIMRFGKPVSVKGAGWHVLIPFLDKLHDVREFNHWTDTYKEHPTGIGCFIELSEQVMDTQMRPYITKDNVNVQVNSIIRWRIVDARKAVFDVDKLHESLRECSLNELRAQIGTMTLDELSTNRTELSQRVQKAVMNSSTRWGIVITSVEIQDIHCDESTKQAMLAQMAAERSSRAAVLDAEGKSKALLTMANAQREALLISARAEKEYLETLASGGGAEDAAKILLNRQMLDSYATITANPAAQVYLPAGTPVVAAAAPRKS